MKKLFYLLSFLLCINNHPSNKKESSSQLIHLLKNKYINPEDVPSEKKQQLTKLLNNNKHEQLSKKLEKLMHNLTKSQNRR